MQVTTLVYGRRPFGVGMLVAGYDVCLHEREREKVISPFASIDLDRVKDRIFIKPVLPPTFMTARPCLLEQGLR